MLSDLVTGRTALREQDGVTETREKRVGEKGERRKYRGKENEIREKREAQGRKRRHGSAVRLSIMVLSALLFRPLGQRKTYKLEIFRASSFP